MSKPQPFILFITGVSAAGKTSVYEALKLDLLKIPTPPDKPSPAIDIHDIDENGVPAVGLTPWRAFRIEELLYYAVQRYNDGSSSIICGVSFPHEIIESNRYSEGMNVHFLLLDISYECFRQRIDERFAAARARGDDNEILQKDNYEQLLAHTKRLRSKLRKIVANQRNGHIVDSSGSIKFTMQHIHEVLATL